jgi:hypothetical protein
VGFYLKQVWVRGFSNMAERVIKLTKKSQITFYPKPPFHFDATLHKQQKIPWLKEEIRL